MAGNGGFKNALNGFDKGEVNAYISELSKKIQELEVNAKEAQEKAVAATKAAAEAEGKVKDIQDSHAAKVLELEAQVKTERRNADNLQNEIDELKRKLRNAGSGSSSGGGKVNTAEAERRSAEIIENANATARDIVEKAKQTAKQVVASAESAAKNAGASGGSGVSAESLKAFQNILSNLTNTVTDALKAANNKASEISVSSGGAPVHIEMPDFSDIGAPQADVPRARGSSKPASSAAGDVGGMDDMFADMMDNGGDMSGFGDIKSSGGAEPADDVLGGFDLSNSDGAMDEFTPSNDFADPFADMDGMVTEVAPLEKKKHGDAAPDDNFAADLLAQTVPGSALGDHLDDDMLAVVRELEEKAAVKPTDEETDLDMDSSSADSGLDAMNALLGQMGSMLENAGGSASDLDLDLGSSNNNSMADDNPWADFQNQIEALEQSAGKTASEQPAQPEPAMDDSVFADPKVPDADDSSIWSFDDMGGSNTDDDMNSGSDDDMSSDLFGSF